MPGEAKLGDAVVDIVGNVAPLQAAIGKARGLISAVVGVGAGMAIVGTALKSWAEKEVIIRNMATALRLFSKGSKESTKSLIDFTNQIQSLSTLSNTDVMQMITRGLQLGVNADSIRMMTKAAVGLGERVGMSTETSMFYLVRAQRGSTTMLQRYIPALKYAKTAQDKFNYALKYSLEGFDLASDKAKTVSGRYAQLKNTLADLWSSIGMRIADKLMPKDLISSIEKAIARVSTVLDTTFKGGKGIFDKKNLEDFSKKLGDILIKITALALTLPEILKTIWKIITGGPATIIQAMVLAVKSFGMLLVEAAIDFSWHVKEGLLTAMLAFSALMKQNIADMLALLAEALPDSLSGTRSKIGKISLLLRKEAKGEDEVIGMRNQMQKEFLVDMLKELGKKAEEAISTFGKSIAELTGVDALESYRKTVDLLISADAKAGATKLKLGKTPKVVMEQEEKTASAQKSILSGASEFWAQMQQAVLGDKAQKTQEDQLTAQQEMVAQQKQTNGYLRDGVSQPVFA